MAGIGGWLGSARRDDTESDIGALVRALGHGGRTPHRSCVEREGAIAVAPGTPPLTGLHVDDRFVVGWMGPVAWSSTHARDAEGDGPALAGAYAAKGPGFLDDLASEIALALLDKDRRELLLAIDRAGIHSLAYCKTPTGVAFASTGRALKALTDVVSEADPQSIFDFVYFHMVPSPRSIYRNWVKLTPAEYVLVRTDAIEHGRYWTPRYVDVTDGNGSAPELAEEYRQTARRAVRACLNRSTGKVGAFLSGGTDSSTVTGLVGELTDAPANTYSIGFDVPGYDESRYARIAVRHFGAKHREYTVTPADVLAAAPKLAEAYDEPFGNASAIASLYCAELARGDGIETLFGGDGGDEIFAGNERYAKQRLFEHYSRLPATLRSGLVEPVVDLLPGNGFGPISKVKSYVRQARIPLPDRLESYNFLTRISPQEIFAPDFLAAIQPDEPLELLRARYREAPSQSVLHRLLYLDLKFTLADNDLRKVGGTCAMAGLEVRYPFLDPELVAFANRVPPDLKLKGQKLRYFFKRASEGFLPHEILAKPKHGFGVPCGRWMREHAPLKELAYDSLASLERRGYLTPAFLERLKGLHAGEHGDYYGVMVWVLTMLELWHQKHVD